MSTETAGERRKSDDLPPDAPDGLKKAADGEETAPLEEREALRWLLGGAGVPLEYTVPVDWDTEDGMKKIPWRLRSLDGRVIEAKENECRKGTGPFAEIDDYRANAAIVAEATLWPDIFAEEFRRPPPTEEVPNPTPDADVVDSLLRVFRYQSGLLSGMAGEVRRISGWAPDRVGVAQRNVTGRPASRVTPTRPPERPAPGSSAMESAAGNS